MYDNYDVCFTLAFYFFLSEQFSETWNCFKIARKSRRQSICLVTQINFILFFSSRKMYFVNNCNIQRFCQDLFKIQTLISFLYNGTIHFTRQTNIFFVLDIFCMVKLALDFKKLIKIIYSLTNTKKYFWHFGMGLYYKPFYVRKLRTFSLVSCLCVRPGAYFRVEYLKGSSLG